MPWIPSLRFHRQPSSWIRPSSAPYCMQFVQARACHYVTVRSVNRKAAPAPCYPHHLVNSVFRWHVRAYCAEREGFRDFNLARIANTLNLTGSRPINADPKHDRQWHETVQLQLAPYPNLSTEEQALLAYASGMRKGRLSVLSRGALVPYTLHAYQVDPSIPDSDNPQRNRLVLANKSDLKSYPWC